MRSPGGQPLANLLDYMVRHNTAANLLLAIMLIGGIAAGLKIRTQFFPDIVRDTVRVTVNWPGAGPEDMDRAVVEVLGPQLLAINGVEEAGSTAREGTATIALEFETGWDMGRATDDVKASVDLARSNLPDGAEEPEVVRGVYRDRVTNVVFYGPVDINQLSRYAEDLQTRLFRQGVTRVEIMGVSDPILRVTASEAALVRYNLTLRDIASVLQAEMETTPAGEVADGSARLRTGQTRRSEKELGEIVLRSPAQGEKLTLRTVTNIQTEGVESGKAYYHKGQPAVLVRVDRSAEGDTISIQKIVEETVADLQSTLPSGVVVRLVQTRSQAIIDRLQEENRKAYLILNKIDIVAKVLFGTIKKAIKRLGAEVAPDIELVVGVVRLEATDAGMVGIAVFAHVGSPWKIADA